MSPFTACRRLLPAITGALLFVSSTVVLAAPPRAAGDGPRGPGARLCAKLSCTAPQEEKVAAIIKALKVEAKPERQAIRALHGEVMAEYAKAKPDQAKMKKAYAQIDEHRKAIRNHVHDAAMELHAVLDAKQRAALAELVGTRGLERMLKGGHGRHGKGKGGKGKAPKNKAPKNQTK